MHDPLKKIDMKELELPETTFVRDIESRVFQSIVIQCLAQIEGVEPIEGTLFDNLLGRDSLDGVKGISVEQEQKSHSVNIRVEVNIAYGICIPDKAEEIQNKILQDVSRLTELHVGRIHVVFKNLISPKLQDAKDSIEESLERCVKGVKPVPVESYEEEF